MKKKLIFGMTIACAATLACSTLIAINHQKIFQTLAGGITENGKDRVLTFDKDSPYTATEHGGYVQEGKFIGLANWGNTSTDGFIKVTDGFFLIFYNQTLGLEQNDYFYGFDQATVTSVSISYKVTEELPFYLKWAKIYSSYAPSSYSAAVCSQTATVSDEVQTMTFTSGDFFDNQTTAKANACKGILLGTTVNKKNFELFNVTVNYTCA